MECLSQDVQPVSSRWASQYRSKLASAREAVGLVRSGDRVWVHPGCCNPEPLVHALVARAGELRDVELVHLMTLGAAPSADPRYAASFRHCALFTGANVRQAVNEGRADFVPVHLSDIPRLITSGRQPIDVAFVHVSPPDEHGFCSFGVGVDCTKAAAEAARDVIALVNVRMPRTLGDCFIHVSRFSHAVEVDLPVVELPRPAELGAVSRAIGRRAAELVENGSTLQMGIGEVPDAILSELKDRRDLGVHTEMFSDGVVELFEAGVINGEAKTLHRGKIVASFVLGHEAQLRLPAQQPLRRVPPDGLRQRPVRDRRQRPHGRDQRGAGRGPHRPGMRGLDRRARSTRASAARPTSSAAPRAPGAASRSSRCLRRRRAERCRASWTRCPRARASSRRARTSTTS